MVDRRTRGDRRLRWPRAGRGGWRLVRAPVEAIPASVRRFNQRARQRRLRAAAPWVAGTLALGLVGLVSWVLSNTSVFGVRRIEVRGATMVSAAQVRSAARVAQGTPLASVDLAAVSRRVQALAAVRKARAGRDWPTALVISVQERTPVGVLPHGERQIDLIDDQGVIYRRVSAAPAGLPTITLAAPGPHDPSTAAALRVLAALSSQLRQRLVAVTAEASTRVRLELTEHRTVIWGDATQNAAKSRIATTLLSRSGGVIDVSAPSVVTVG